MVTTDLPNSIAVALSAAGTDTVFGMPGGGNNLDFIGAVEKAGMRFVLAHAETPAALMAAVYGDLTNTPGACVVTRGPGAASAVNGVANALLDRQQLVMVTDAVSTVDYERIAHQRLDQHALYGPVCKWTASIGSVGATETAKHAIAMAMTHPRGPVHLDYDPAATSTAAPTLTETEDDSIREMSQLGDLVAQAKRPVVLLGVGARGLTAAIRSLLTGSAAPVLMTYRAKGLVPDSWASNGGLLTGATTESPLLAQADLIVMIGVDTVELIPNGWAYGAPVISLAGWAETSPYFRAEVEVVGDLDKLVPELAQYWPTTTWVEDAGSRHRDDELDRLRAARPADPVGVVPQDVVERSRVAAPAGSVATVDAGAHMLPAMSLWDVENVDEVLISSGLATMGFAVPAAIGAALARPERRIVCFTGDGGLGMALGELETISRLQLSVTVVVFNDSRLSLIAIKAKPDGNGGDNAIGYGETDFAAIGDAFGLRGLRAASVDALDSALTEAFAHEGPSLIDVRVDPSAYGAVLNSIRGARA